ncbi:SRF-type transcription factor (DNA-binding and dimerization domain) [Ceratobasidium sp. AG-Ba]|nr:SRF-type transcription factor (DNA-binding and dimerization domain) [Ceratobasidium sp. AG-Ba]QRW15012.1 SRF-type transcription factor (DNA-binding and dimerization domain) [Ceratobasidium sp. AG-Ba]
MSAPSTYPPSAPVSAGAAPAMATSPRSKRPRPPDLHTGSAAGLPATTGAPASSGPTSAGFTPASATAGGDDVFHQEDGEDAEDDDEEEGGRKEKKAGRRKIKIEFIQDKSRRHITFSKRKAGIMKKASRSPSRHALAPTCSAGIRVVHAHGYASAAARCIRNRSRLHIYYRKTPTSGHPTRGQELDSSLPQCAQRLHPGGCTSLGPGATSPDEGDEDGEGSGDSPNMGSSKGRQRRRTNSNSGAVAMNRSISSPSESLPATSPTLGMQQPQGVSGGAPYNGHPAAHSPTLGQPHHHPHHPHMAESGMYAGYRGGEGGAAGAGMMPAHHYQYSGMNAAGMASGLNAGSVPGGAIGQGAGQQQQSQSQMWMQQGNMQRR